MSDWILDKTMTGPEFLAEMEPGSFRVVQLNVPDLPESIRSHAPPGTTRFLAIVLKGIDGSITVPLSLNLDSAKQLARDLRAVIDGMENGDS